MPSSGGKPTARSAATLTRTTPAFLIEIPSRERFATLSRRIPHLRATIYNGAVHVSRGILDLR
jgi:hypothetical protein